MKKNVTGLTSILLLMLILLFPQTALQGASKGLLLWFNRIIPALLPCMMLTQLCMHSGILEKLTASDNNAVGNLCGLSGYGLYIALLGLLCGFPMGAKLVHDFYIEKKITKNEAGFLLTFCSQLSPAFLAEYVLTDVFEKVSLRRVMILSYYMSVFFLWLISRCIFRRFSFNGKMKNQGYAGIACSEQTKKEVSQTFCLSENLDTSIMNSLDTILRVGGYMILFSVLAAGLKKNLQISETGNSILVSLLEITTGLEQMASCPLSPLLKGILINSLCAFGGLSSLMQVLGALKGTELPVRICFIAKAGQAILTALMTGLLLFFVL